MQMPTEHALPFTCLSDRAVHVYGKAAYMMLHQLLRLCYSCDTVTAAVTVASNALAALQL